MFSRNKHSQEPERPAAAEMALISGGGLVQAVVTSQSPFTYRLFLNDREVPQAEVESLDVEIDDGSATEPPTARATLARYVRSVTGDRSLTYSELFPCNLEIVAVGRRISIVCQEAGSLDGLWVAVGLRPDGTAAAVDGARALRIVLADGVLEAKLTWADGAVEDLLPHDAT